MIKTPKIKKESFSWKKLSLLKVAKYISIIFGAVILFILLLLVLFPDYFVNTFLKDRITKAFTDAYPTYTLQLSDMHYNIWKNRLGCDSITVRSNDSTFNCSVEKFSISGISWMKILLQKDYTSNVLTSSVTDAQNIVLSFQKTPDEYRFKALHISLPDSEMTADSIKYYSLVDDEKFFGKSKFRQTRFRIDIPQIKIIGLDFPELLKGNIYKARLINMDDVYADIMVNMDKPYNINSPNPQMPNEILYSMKEKIKLDSLKITNGKLKYSERFTIGKKPGVITFNKVNVSVSGIVNSSIHPESTIIHGEGLFMNSSKMKLLITIPLSSKDFSLKYSGSLNSMDVTKLNAFIEAGEYHRIKSGILQHATYNIDVNSGRARGTLKVAYQDLSIALLNKDTGSEKGIFNRILSFFGKVFVVRGSNMPDENGSMKIGEITYTRNPKDYFLQFLWFALRSGIADVVGFPKE